jgi:hypothetical protein
MLRKSWQIIVQGTAEDPGLVPIDSLAFSMSARVFGGGVWLSWRGGDERSSEDLARWEAIEDPGPPSSSERFFNWAIWDDGSSRGELVKGLRGRLRLEPLETDLLRYLLEMASPAADDDEATEAPAWDRRLAELVDRARGIELRLDASGFHMSRRRPVGELDPSLAPARLVRTFGLPVATIGSAMASLLGKLGAAGLGEAYRSSGDSEAEFEWLFDGTPATVMRVASFFPFQTTYYLNGHSFIAIGPKVSSRR